MGHLVNPVAWRLGKNIYWKSLYYINNLDFAYNNINDINLFIFLNKFFKNKFLKFSNLSISNFKILKFFSGTFVYALFKSHNYGSKGLYKYPRRIFLDRLLLKKQFKKKTPYLKKIYKKNTLSKIKYKPAINKRYSYMPQNFSKKADIVNFTDCRIEKFRKIMRKNRFIFRKCNFNRRRRYPKKNYFLNYCFYVNNFKKSFGHTHKREAEHYIVSTALKKLKRLFSVKFSKKGSRSNSVFNNYFFKNPRRYFKNRSYSSRPGSWILTTPTNSEAIPYVYRKFFAFNILKLFPKVFLNISDRYNSLSKGYIFIKNKFKFKAGFYNNFLHMYRKFPTFIFIKNFLSSFVNKFFSQVRFTFIFCSERYISANLMRDFILIKMSQKFRLGKITFMALRLLGDLYKKNIIKGFRILLAGRFSRKDRATFYWKKGGFLSFNDRMSALDYSFGTKVLRYSLCVCKIWINN